MNRVSEFADSFIPGNLPQKRKQALKDELICHILDKADYYKELGYEESVSYNKAIEDFGTDSIMKKYIFEEFEELYQERTIWGILAALFIYAINWLCFPMDIWVSSADYNRDPDPAGAFVSFCMIYMVLALIIFARIKKYRKMLLCIGISNVLVLGILLWCFYPQMAAYSMLYNTIYLIDRFTPLLLGNSLIADGFLSVAVWVCIPAVLALYSITASLLLKAGKIGDIKNPRKKCMITGIICVSVCIITCVLQPAGLRYYDDYPVWFNPYNLYIAEETEAIYEKIYTGDSIENAESILRSEGFCSIEEYSSQLDRLTKKQFDANAEELTFINGYTIYFNPEKYIKGDGFVGVKAENGIVTGVVVGNVGKYMYDKKNETFGYSDTRNWKARDRIDELEEYFGTLKKGDREEDIIISYFGSECGKIYTKKKYIENDIAKTYYRIHFYGLENPDAKDYEKNDSRYIELTFSDGLLESGALYSNDYIDNEAVITKKSIE